MCPKTELMCAKIEAKTEATDDVPPIGNPLMCPFRKLADRELMCANSKCWFLVHTGPGFGGCLAFICIALTQQYGE